MWQCVFSVLQAPHSYESQYTLNTPTPQPSPKLTAVPLVTHVPAVVVRVTPPDAIDAVPVATAILVAKAGVLWPSEGGGEEANQRYSHGRAATSPRVPLSPPQTTRLTQ